MLEELVASIISLTK